LQRKNVSKKIKRATLQPNYRDPSWTVTLGWLPQVAPVSQS